MARDRTVLEEAQRVAHALLVDQELNEYTGRRATRAHGKTTKQIVKKNKLPSSKAKHNKTKQFRRANAVGRTQKACCERTVERPDGSAVATRAR